MLEMTALQRNHLYEFRGQQLRYSHQSNCGVNAPFIFNDSLMLTQRIKPNPSAEGGF
jgi:hypothetical protein